MRLIKTMSTEDKQIFSGYVTVILTAGALLLLGNSMLFFAISTGIVAATAFIYMQYVHLEEVCIE